MIILVIYSKYHILSSPAGRDEGNADEKIYRVKDKNREDYSSKKIIYVKFLVCLLYYYEY